jgi:hypothetical protein
VPKTHLIILVATLVLSLLWSAEAHACETVWTSFVQAPSLATYKALDHAIPKCREDHILLSDRTSHLLEQLVEAKNRYAIDIAFSSLDFFDGGNLEDIVQALGLLAESNPRLLLKNFVRYHLGFFTLKQILLSLPERTVDDIEAKRLRLHERIERMTTVNDSELNALKRQSLQILKEAYQKMGRPAAR